jgi:hypothetical protein
MRNRFASQIAAAFCVPFRFVGKVDSKMHPDREILFEFVTRMRESQEQERMAIKNRDGWAMARWSARTQAFNEVYTELKGSGFGRKGGI